jgi:hypothetical protein
MLFILLTISVVYAQIPRTISYQGVLTDASGNVKPDGDYTITFSFYENEAGGDAIWSETKALKCRSFCIYKENDFASLNHLHLKGAAINQAL